MYLPILKEVGYKIFCNKTITRIFFFKRGNLELMIFLECNSLWVKYVPNVTHFKYFKFSYINQQYNSGNKYMDKILSRYVKPATFGNDFANM